MRQSVMAPEGAATARREQILTAAVAVFSRQGFASASIKDIAREAGVAPGLLHYYFASKEALVLEAIDAIETRFAHDWMAFAYEVEDPMERIFKGIDAMASSGVIDLHWMSTVEDPAIRDRSLLLWSRFQKGVEFDLRRVLGELPAYRISPKDVAGVVCSALSGMPITAVNEPEARARSLRTIKIMLLSVVVAAYVAAGSEVPMEKIRALLPRE